MSPTADALVALAAAHDALLRARAVAREATQGRAEAAARARAAGHSLAEIGRALGCSRVTALELARAGAQRLGVDTRLESTHEKRPTP